MNKKIKSLLKSSEQVIKDCSLPNGAIVAANSSKAYYPKQAKYYKFVWPRDALFICKAASILKINIYESFFKWCLKAEDWKKTGLFYEKYYVNGKKARNNFQPDQTGSVLMALHDFLKNNKTKIKKHKDLLTNSANGLCKVWDKDHFKIVSQDLWEEKFCFPDLKENFSYSLAICAKGLECANKIIPNKVWEKTSKEMKKVLLKSFSNHFYRSFGIINDERTDASLLGLFWPSEIVSVKDIRMKNTVRIIEKNLVKNMGVYRYENDEYDGWMYKDVNRKKGAGYWPLLNFWLTIYHVNVGDKKKALKLYKKVISDLKNKNFIPEQIFDNDLQVAVSPLCWSHAMFVIASQKLGFLD